MSSETTSHPDQQGRQPVSNPATEQKSPDQRAPGKVLIQSYSETHSGPLPSPKAFFEYGQVVPDAPERILRLAEKDQQQYFDVIFEKIRSHRFGQWFGVGATSTGFIYALVALLIGETTASIVALTAVVASTILHIFKR